TDRDHTKPSISRPKPAHEHNLALGTDGLTNSRQHRYRRRRTVQLPAAMIGDDNGSCTRLGGKLGVLNVENALYDQLAWPDASYPFEVFPAQRFVELMPDPFQ